VRAGIGTGTGTLAHADLSMAGQSATRAQPSPLLPSSGPLAPGNGARRGSTSSESYVRQATQTSAAAAGHKKPERTFTETLKVSPLGRPTACGQLPRA
jgi:hypothetical protein